jgi:hypothetical protein
LFFIHFVLTVKPHPVEDLKDGILLAPNSFIPGRKGSLTIQIAANPNLTNVHWTVNGKEADGKKFRPLSINQSKFIEVKTFSLKLCQKFLFYCVFSLTRGWLELTWIYLQKMI